jgi:hypothetical protein
MGLILAFLAILIPSGWTFNSLWQTSRIEGYGAFLGSAVLRPIRVNDTDGILLWLHTDPAFNSKLRPVVTIPDLPEGAIKSGFVAIQGHGEVLRGEHYLLVEGVRQWIPTEVFVAEVRKWLGYDAQVLLLACNPDHVRIDIPNTIYWQDNLVDVTYGVGPWVMGKYFEDDPDNGLQRPILTDSQPPAYVPTPMEEAIAKLHAAIGAQTMPEPEVTTEAASEIPASSESPPQT